MKMPVSVTSTPNRISIKDGVFTIFKRGEEKFSIQKSINVVFVDQASMPSRAYYDAPYDEKVRSLPVCWSTNGRTPDRSVHEPQSEVCMNCTQNIIGSGKGSSKACKYNWRTAVVFEDSLVKDIFRLTIPPTSIWGKGDVGKRPFKEYLNFLVGGGLPINKIVTEIRFDLDFPVPKVYFQPVRALTEDEYFGVNRRRSEPEVTNCITLNYEELRKEDLEKKEEYKKLTRFMGIDN